MLLHAVVAIAPGVSIEAGILLMIPAFEMIAGEHAPAFPRRIAVRPLPTRHFAAVVQRAMQVLRYLEKLIHPRWPALKLTPNFGRPVKVRRVLFWRNGWSKRMMKTCKKFDAAVVWKNLRSDQRRRRFYRLHAGEKKAGIGKATRGASGRDDGLRTRPCVAGENLPRPRLVVVVLRLSGRGCGHQQWVGTQAATLCDAAKCDQRLKNHVGLEGRSGCENDNRHRAAQAQTLST
jgi:hypothetical protein